MSKLTKPQRRDAVIQTYLPSGIHEAIRELSQRTGVSMSSIVAEMVLQGAAAVARRLLDLPPVQHRGNGGYELPTYSELDTPPKLPDY